MEESVNISEEDQKTINDRLRDFNLKIEGCDIGRVQLMRQHNELSADYNNYKRNSQLNMKQLGDLTIWVNNTNPILTELQSQSTLNRYNIHTQ